MRAGLPVDGAESYPWEDSLVSNGMEGAENVSSDPKERLGDEGVRGGRGNLSCMARMNSLSNSGFGIS
jgi:hypothetical protein